MEPLQDEKGHGKDSWIDDVPQAVLGVELPGQLHAAVHEVVGDLGDLPELVRVQTVPGQETRLKEAQQDEQLEVRRVLQVRPGVPPLARERGVLGVVLPVLGVPSCDCLLLLGAALSLSLCRKFVCDRVLCHEI